MKLYAKVQSDRRAEPVGVGANRSLSIRLLAEDKKIDKRKGVGIISLDYNDKLELFELRVYSRPGILVYTRTITEGSD